MSKQVCVVINSEGRAVIAFPTYVMARVWVIEHSTGVYTIDKVCIEDLYRSIYR